MQAFQRVCAARSARSASPPRGLGEPVCLLRMRELSVRVVPTVGEDALKRVRAGARARTRDAARRRARADGTGRRNFDVLGHRAPPREG